MAIGSYNIGSTNMTFVRLLSTPTDPQTHCQKFRTLQRTKCLIQCSESRTDAPTLDLQMSFLFRAPWIGYAVELPMKYGDSLHRLSDHGAKPESDHCRVAHHAATCMSGAAGVAAYCGNTQTVKHFTVRALNRYCPALSRHGTQSRIRRTKSSVKDWGFP